MNVQKEKGLTASARTLNLLFNEPFRWVKGRGEETPERAEAFEERAVPTAGPRGKEGAEADNKKRCISPVTMHAK